jgi:hypothetical protein
VRCQRAGLHAGGETEDFGVTRDCEHQNGAPDDILRRNDLIEGAAMPLEGWAVPTQPRQSSRQRSAARRPFRR